MKKIAHKEALMWTVALLWLWLVGACMAVGRITFEGDVSRWRRVVIWTMWPVTFPVVVKMQWSGEIGS